MPPTTTPAAGAPTPVAANAAAPVIFPTAPIACFAASAPAAMVKRPNTPARDNMMPAVPHNHMTRIRPEISPPPTKKRLTAVVALNMPPAASGRMATTTAALSQRPRSQPICGMTLMIATGAEITARINSTAWAAAKAMNSPTRAMMPPIATPRLMSGPSRVICAAPETMSPTDKDLR
ncbi:MAG: hypothetical protein C0411_17080 [Pseudomonas sp.]|nr:hypothetical protein [Pseudomonas sp.]